MSYPLSTVLGMSTIRHLVYGERLGDLLPVLRAITQRAHLDDVGMFVFEGRFEPHTATPFIRALMPPAAPVSGDVRP